MDESAIPIDVASVFTQWNNVRESLSPFWISSANREKLSFDQVTEVDFLKELEWKLENGQAVIKK